MTATLPDLTPPTPKTAPQAVRPSHRLALGDCVLVEVPGVLSRIPGRYHLGAHGERVAPMLKLERRRRTGYVTMLDGHWQGSVPCYRVFTPADGCESTHREDRVTPVPTGLIPRVVCVMPDGRRAELNYLAYRPVTLHADEPHLPRDWTPADRALWEAFTLARYYARTYPGHPRDYWVGYPVGTCYHWHKIDPAEPVPHGGVLAHPRFPE